MVYNHPYMIIHGQWVTDRETRSMKKSDFDVLKLDDRQREDCKPEVVVCAKNVCIFRFSLK